MKERSPLLPWWLLLLIVATTTTRTTHAQVVVTTPGAGDDTDTAPDCIPTINQVALRESTVADTSQSRLYTLCPGMTYSMGQLNFDNEVEFGQRMLPLRSNLKVQCGTAENTGDCILDGGDLQVDGTDHFGMASTEPMENIVLKGLTFRNVTKYMAWFNRPGTVEFVDCEFRENENALAPLFLDFFNPNDSSQELSVTFRNCLFDQNQYFGMPAYPALIVGNGRQNRIIIEESRFTNNDMLFNNTLNETSSFLVEASGPITVLRSCFENNQIGVSPIAVYGSEYLFAENYQSFSAGKLCSMSSHFETSEQYELFTPRCEQFDVRGFGAVCPLDGTSSPTPPPAPTVSPTMAPTPKTPIPSESPSTTTAPSTVPSWFPTPQPTEKPSTGAPDVTSVPTAETIVSTPKPSLQSSDTLTNRPPVSLQLTDPPTLAPYSFTPVESSSRRYGPMMVSLLLTWVVVVAVW